MATILERVKKIVEDRLGVDEAAIVPSASFAEDLGADSLDLVELIMAFEEEFSEEGMAIEISDEQAETIVTIQNAVDFLTSQGVQDS